MNRLEMAEKMGVVPGGKIHPPDLLRVII